MVPQIVAGLVVCPSRHPAGVCIFAMSIDPAPTHPSLYPKQLVPDSEQSFTLEDAEYRVPVRNLRLKRWVGDPILNTFGGKPLIDGDGSAEFAELAICRMAIADGWSARWVEAYASGNVPYFFEEWTSVGLKHGPRESSRRATAHDARRNC